MKLLIFIVIYALIYYVAVPFALVGVLSLFGVSLGYWAAVLCAFCVYIVLGILKS